MANRRLDVPAGAISGYWTVIGESGGQVRMKRGKPEMVRNFNVVCRCGTIGVRTLQVLKKRGLGSCGCRLRESSHGNRLTHGLTRSRLFILWTSIKQRCYNPKAVSFKCYGARGIRMADEWVDDFSNFNDWVNTNLGPRPTGTSLDRIDPNLGYQPGNLRWATHRQQARNRRNNRHIVHPLTGETMLLCEWAEKIGVLPVTLCGRLRKWGPLRALSMV